MVTPPDPAPAPREPAIPLAYVLAALTIMGSLAAFGAVLWRAARATARGEVATERNTEAMGKLTTLVESFADEVRRKIHDLRNDVQAQEVDRAARDAREEAASQLLTERRQQIDGRISAIEARVETHAERIGRLESARRGHGSLPPDERSHE